MLGRSKTSVCHCAPLEFRLKTKSAGQERTRRPFIIVRCYDGYRKKGQPIILHNGLTKGEVFGGMSRVRGASELCRAFPILINTPFQRGVTRIHSPRQPLQRFIVSDKTRMRPSREKAHKRSGLALVKMVFGLHEPRPVLGWAKNHTLSLCGTAVPTKDKVSREERPRKSLINARCCGGYR